MTCLCKEPPRRTGNEVLASYCEAIMPPAQADRCFLCNPEPEWTWLESQHFRAVLGLGPIGLGYTLIASREHLPSMLDLEEELADELTTFTELVQQRLGALWGDSVLCEHGRVAPCVAAATRSHEPHCLHAHRLVFPGHSKIDLRQAAPRMQVLEFASFSAARDSLDWPGQYVYAQAPNGPCQVGLVSGPLPRQFLRAVVAASKGQRELADWRSSPRRHELDRARQLLGAFD